MYTLYRDRSNLNCNISSEEQVEISQSVPTNNFSLNPINANLKLEEATGMSTSQMSIMCEQNSAYDHVKPSDCFTFELTEPEMCEKNPAYVQWDRINALH